MGLDISVCDTRFSGQIQHVLDGLRKLGCDRADKFYMLTSTQLASAAITLHSLKLLQTTVVAMEKIASGDNAPPSQIRIICKLLEDKASRDVAFKLSVNLTV
jgi:hypothetical protein